ncbi:hypothetical protein B0A69_07540 [Chryseobacterium shigense]|uniref:Uncharacterized protein n=1 Tax=Chryseobacterium shigense TaxID=297244 RepID=A0A1N7I643_9FLAO|nr:hypothetical protein [Chryseobacterium shigense]PQA95285.1 hypothetical protein B0A69_07540 [Chryseobacterium shigense]SIS32556.1 hypothetical protein SAMN05421639_102281 [Chryseobacterium shigense]
MKQKFKIMESEINRPLTYAALGLVWVTIAVIMTITVLLFYKLFEHGFHDLSYNRSHFFMILITEAILISCCLFLIIHIVGAKKKYFKRIVVDENGAHVYNYKKELIDNTLYSDLCKSKDPFLPDVSDNTSTQPSFTKSLRIFRKNKSNQIETTFIDFNYSYYQFKNKSELYRHFLQGIQIFRPDLTIGQYTLEEYNLTDKTSYVQKWKGLEWLITLLFMAVLFGLLYLLVLFLK